VHFDGVEVEQRDPLDPDSGEGLGDEHADAARADDADVQSGESGLHVRPPG
jgi:hypothetical protein